MTCAVFTYCDGLFMLVAPNVSLESLFIFRAFKEIFAVQLANKALLGSIKSRLGKLTQMLGSNGTDSVLDDAVDWRTGSILEVYDYTNHLWLRGLNATKTKEEETLYNLTGNVDIMTLERDNQSWLVIHKRGPMFNPPRSAMNIWQVYKDGFGSNSTNEFWIGLENIHQITKKRGHRLRVEAWNSDDIDIWNETVDGFSIGGEDEAYRLNIDVQGAGQLGPMVQAFVYHNGSKFSTGDHDNDEWDGGNCATAAGGGWWYKNCADILPTGHYYSLWVADKPLSKVHYFDNVIMMIDWV